MADFFVKLDSNGLPISSSLYLGENLRQMFLELADKPILTHREVTPFGFAPFVHQDPPQLDNPFEYLAVESVPEQKNANGEFLQNWKIVKRQFQSNADEDQAKANFLNLKKSTVKELIESKRQEFERVGFDYVFPDKIKGRIQTRNIEDIRNIQSLITVAQMLVSQNVTKPVLQFRDNQNKTHDMTPAQIINLGAALHNFIADTYKWSWSFKERLNLSKTLDEVVGIEREIQSLHDH